MNKYVKYMLAASTLAIFSLVALHYRQAYIHADTEYRSDLYIVEVTEAALNEYAETHEGRLPNSHNWEESIEPYWMGDEYSVLIKEHPGDRLAMNSKLSGVKVDQISQPDTTVVLYETHSNTKDTSGAPPWEQYHQCNRSAKGWLMMAFASGWACSCAKGSEISFNPKNN